jgi:hypothetical protein
VQRVELFRRVIGPSLAGVTAPTGII